jgi:hypothetical protein
LGQSQTAIASLAELLHQFNAAPWLLERSMIQVPVRFDVRGTPDLRRVSRRLRGSCITIFLMSAAACARRLPPRLVPAPSVPVGLDHIVVAIDTLERGVAQVEALTGTRFRTGLRYLSKGYGAEPGRGLKSAVLRTGANSYLELVAPDYDDPNAAALGPIYARYREPTPLGWFIRVSNADSVRTALTTAELRPLPTIAGVAVTATTDTVRWESVHFAHQITTLAPVFIAWRERAHADSGWAGQNGCTLETFTLRYARPEFLDSTFRAAHVPVRVEIASGRATGIEISMRCPGGTVSLPRSAARM